LLASTSEIYGEPLEHPQREVYWGQVNPNGARSCYDKGKRFAEAMTAAYLHKHGVSARIVRIFNTYGPRSDPSDGRLVPNLITQALGDMPLTVYGDGQQTRSFCYVADLVDGLVRTSLSPRRAAVHLTWGTRTSTRCVSTRRSSVSFVAPTLPWCTSLSRQQWHRATRLGARRCARRPYPTRGAGTQ